VVWILCSREFNAALKDNGGVILSKCSFRMHLPSEGLPRNVAAPVIDMLYPPGKCRIPIIAVTGTNENNNYYKITSTYCKTMVTK
jgi:cyanophycin synthetase